MSDIYKLPESHDGSVVFKIPFPENLKDLARLSPMVVKRGYLLEYMNSYGQDSPFFAGLSNGIQLGTRCESCDYTYATPRMACEKCGGENVWVELPEIGVIHTFTVCHFGSEAFLDEVPFTLALIEYSGVDTLFLTRLVGFDPMSPSLQWIGQPVKRRFVRNSKLLPTDVYYVPDRK
ncbi:MAG: Zn-ribbon domain-containing OB-fold protein [Spirochaetota bacterium]|nr:Zn-ribbon domain-containing OB-fold protein [Spirochaetota bacterium]